MLDQLHDITYFLRGIRQQLHLTISAVGLLYSDDIVNLTTARTTGEVPVNLVALADELIE
jgi:hypothetical protein